MSTPAPDENHARLQRLLGVWLGEEKMQPSQWVPEEVIASAHIVSKPGAGGLVVHQDYEQRSGETVTFSGHGVFWFDKEPGEVCLHFWDSFGAKPDIFRGAWDGDHLVLRSKNSMGHWRGTWVLGYGVYRHTMETSQDGDDWTVVMEGEYRRQE